MNIRNLYNPSEVEETLARINALTPASKGLWGKMTVDQMLAHVNVAYDMTFTDKYPKPGAIGKFMIKLFAKKAVVGPAPYPKNGRTALQFIISDSHDFEAEKAKLIANINRVLQLGEKHFENMDSHSLGKLTSQEWNVMFSKHIDHHLTQFGV